MKRIILIPVFLMSLAGLAQTDSSTVRFTNPTSLSAPRGYSHAAIIDLGSCKMVVISGQVSLDEQGNLVGKGDIAKQTEQVFLTYKVYWPASVARWIT